MIIKMIITITGMILEKMIGKEIILTQ